MAVDYYGYDSLNRITTITENKQSNTVGETGVFTQAFTYDRWGNRTINVSGTTPGIPGVTRTNQVIDTATNRMTSIDGVGLSYDEDGNQTANGTEQRWYDAENRMTKATGGGLNYYYYDADGKRARRVIGAQEYWQVYGFEGELVAEYTYDGVTAPAPTATQKEYGYRSGQLLVVAQCDVMRWLVADHLGSPRMEADVTGSLANMRRHDYLPFGEEIGAGVGFRTTGQGYTADCVRQRFTSKERDGETGLDYFLARYHSSVQGRFTSVDPENAGADPEDPQSWNGYAYARSNPVLFTDPDGEKYLVCGAEGGCGIISDQAFWNDRRYYKAQGFEFTGSGDFFESGVIIKDGKILATYEQISIDDPTREFAYEMRRALTDPSTRRRAAVNAIIGVFAPNFYRFVPRGQRFSTIDRLSRAAAAPSKAGYTSGL
jgi:RHS repeat-associated protein